MLSKPGHTYIVFFTQWDQTTNYVTVDICLELTVGPAEAGKRRWCDSNIRADRGMGNLCINHSCSRSCWWERTNKKLQEKFWRCAPTKVNQEKKEKKEWSLSDPRLIPEWSQSGHQDHHYKSSWWYEGTSTCPLNFNQKLLTVQICSNLSRCWIKLE